MSGKKADLAATDERVGSVILDRYRIIELIGVGGRGKVYSGEHLAMKKRVAVKFLHPELSSVPELLARFEREAVTAANIDHPNVAAATDFGKLPDGSMFLVLEFVDGKSLRDEIAAGALPVERALRIARQIAAALSSAHALGIVHRDLKPENVMLVARSDEPDFVKVLDFGVARVAPNETSSQLVAPLTQAGMVFGTPEYMAPEQALGQKVDGRADLYALGAITFEMLSGTRPFPSESETGILGLQLSRPVPSISERAPGARVPPRVEELVTKLLAKDAGERYQTADELVQALDELLGLRATGAGNEASSGAGSKLASAGAVAGAVAKTGSGAGAATSTGPGTAILGSLADVYGPKGVPSIARAPATPAPPRPPAHVPPPAPTRSPAHSPPPAPVRAAPPPPTRSAERPAPPAPPPAAPSAALGTSVERAAAKESFSADEGLPAFTFPVLDDKTKQELLRSVEQARAAPQSSVERAAAKESFSAGEALPAFTFPALDDATKQELLRSVEQARAASAHGPLPPPRAPALGPRSGSKTFAKLISELRRIGSIAWTRGSALARRWIESACAFIDRNRARLPARLRDRLSTVRAGVILAVFATLAFSILLGVVLLIGSGGSEKDGAASAPSALVPPPPPKADPVPAEIDEAKKQGLAALEKLAERHPKDHRVWLALAAASSEKAEYAAAVRAVNKALGSEPKASEQVIASDVLAIAVRKRETVDAAFLLLEGPMASSGATVLYDLSIDPAAPLPLRARAEEWVRSEAFKKVAAPDVEIAGALRYAKSCSDRHALLPRAQEKGGQRVLAFLNIAKNRVGCGRGARDDCFPCLRRDSALKDAIEAIEKRLGKN